MRLRAFTKEDAQTICGWIRTEKEMYQWSADRINMFPLRPEYIEKEYAMPMASGRFFPLVMVDEEDTPVGQFIIRYPKPDDDTTVRFGFVVVNPDIRGKGYGKQMLTLGIEYVKEHLGAKRITLGVFSNNDKARYCYESVGFREYKRKDSQLQIGIWECIDMELVLE